MIKIADRHIFLEWLKSFILTLGVILAFLVLQDMYNELVDLINLGAKTQDIVRYYWALIPSFMPIIIPLAFLVSLLYSMGKLHQNMEIIALRASGLSPLKITRSLWLAAAGLTGLLLFLNTHIVPHAIEESRAIWDDLRFAREAKHQQADAVATIPNLTFDHQGENRLWFMNSFSEYTNRAQGVTVHTINDEGQETKRIAANEAYYDKDAGYWVFINGREMTFDLADGDPDESFIFDKRLYTDLTESPSIMKALNKSPQDLSLREINQLLKAIPVDKNPKLQAYAVHRQKTLASPFGCLVVVAIAIPFATSGVRTNPMIGVSKASAIFVFYYCITTISGFIGGHFHISSTLAVWIPNLIMIGVALHLHRKSY